MKILNLAGLLEKKNIITDKSSFENIVFMHDYLLLHKNWYKGFVNFGNDFEIAMNKILNPDKVDIEIGHCGHIMIHL